MKVRRKKPIALPNGTRIIRRVFEGWNYGEPPAMTPTVDEGWNA